MGALHGWPVLSRSSELAAVDIAYDDRFPEPPSDRLVALARSRAADDRQRLLMGLADLVEASGRAADDVASEIFLTIIRDVERDIRKALSERLAQAEWAPPALINILALDEIEIARPIIAKSPLLRDQDLIRVLVEATVEHQIEVARRPNVGATVVDAIIDRSEPAVLTALAGNPTANISEIGIRRLVETSRRIAGLRAPLARHPRLTEELAQHLYAWVGQALRQAIGERFRIDTQALEAAMADAVQTAANPQAPAAAGASTQIDPQRDEMERRLIAKLDSAGQLRPGYLVRAAREGRISLFENALAVLGGYPVDMVRQAVMADTAEALALACASVGIDRAAFPSMLAEVRARSGGRPLGPGLDIKVLRLFDLDADTAARAFRRAVEAGQQARSV